MSAAKIRPDQREEVRRRYLKGGESLTSLAREFGCAHVTVWRAVGMNLDAEERRRRQVAGGPLGGRKRTPEKAAASRQNLENYRKRAAAVSPIQRDFLTAADAAAELGISRFTMLEYLRDGRLPGAFQIGQRARFWLVPRKAVEERKRRRTPIP